MSRRNPGRRSNLRVESLEDRLAPAIFLVTTTVDDNNGATNGVSLREAILSANASAEADTINFAIPTSDPNRNPTTGVCTISPTTPLPGIIDTVTIDGYSQLGSSKNTLELDEGNNAKL